MTAVARVTGLSLMRLIGLSADTISSISLAGICDRDIIDTVEDAFPVVWNGEGSSTLHGVARRITGEIQTFWACEYV